MEQLEWEVIVAVVGLKERFEFEMRDMVVGLTGQLEWESMEVVQLKERVEWEVMVSWMEKLVWISTSEQHGWLHVLRRNLSVLFLIVSQFLCFFLC